MLGNVQKFEIKYKMGENSISKREKERRDHFGVIWR